VRGEESKPHFLTLFTIPAGGGFHGWLCARLAGIIEVRGNETEELPQQALLCYILKAMRAINAVKRN
jgi:hypothetical protein